MTDFAQAKSAIDPGFLHLGVRPLKLGVCSYKLLGRLDRLVKQIFVSPIGSLDGFVDTQNLIALHITKGLPDSAWPADIDLFDRRLTT